MSTQRTRSGVLAAAFVTAILLSAGAQAAGVVIQIPGPPVPTILLPAPPPMVWLPSLGIYVAHNSSRPIFFHEGRYYVRDRGMWFAAQSYRGPWGRVDSRLLPPPLHSYHDRDWDRYQNEAATYYRYRKDRAQPAFYPGNRDRHEYRDSPRNRNYGRHEDQGGERHDGDGRRYDSDR